MSDIDQPNGDSGLSSLLSLSMAASSAAPIPINSTLAVDSDLRLGQSSGAALKHRRLSSAGATRRRLSDARDAAVRPSPQSLQAGANALNSLASLSLSTSHSNAQTPIPSSVPTPAIAIPSRVNGAGRADVVSSYQSSSAQSPPSSYTEPIEVEPISVDGSGGKSGKKRGTIFTCESCSKVYRHPSCLIKHRWEHSPHWREASKFVLSKHQQVQLLEAAAILSHISPNSDTGTSLPEDRSLWPSFLSNGVLPPPSTSTPMTSAPVSSSVPARGGSIGPRMHDYDVGDRVNVTQVRPGVLGVSTPPPSVTPSYAPSSAPVPVPMAPSSAARGIKIESTWGSAGGGGWSIPRSSVRSSSVSSAFSRERSTPSDEELDIDIDGDDVRNPYTRGYGFGGRYSYGKIDEETEMKEKHQAPEWDGMEMEMEME